MPGAPFKFPVLIEMDDDARAEQMSLVFARADGLPAAPVAGALRPPQWPRLPAIDTQNLPPGSRVTVDAFASASTVPGVTVTPAPVAVVPAPVAPAPVAVPPPPRPRGVVPSSPMALSRPLR